MTELMPKPEAPRRSAVDEDEIDIGHYVRVLLRGWWLIAIVAIAGAAAGLLVATRIPHRYEASTLLRITPPRYGPAVVANAPAVLAVIQNRGVAAGVVKDLGLDKPPHSLTAQSFVDSALNVETLPSTNYLRLRVRLLDRGLATEAVRTLADRTVAESRVLGREEAIAYNKQLEEQFNSAATRLRTAEQTFFGFGKEAQIEALESQLTTVLEQRATLSGVEAERARLKEAEAQLAKTPRTLSVKGADLPGDGVTTTSSKPATASAGAVREVLNPAYDKLEEEIAESRNTLAALQRTREQLAATPPSVSTSQLYQKKQELARLKTEYDLAARFYSDRATAYENARVQAESAGDELRVIQLASAPDRPLSRRPTMLAGLGFAVGLVLASGAVLLRAGFAE
jgi:uncharacterized protein involved in exopolysaccharide biosynthesis